MAKSDATYVYVTVGTAYKLLRANASMTDVNASTSYQELVAAGIRLDPDTKNRYFRNEPFSLSEILAKSFGTGLSDSSVISDLPVLAFGTGYSDAASLADVFAQATTFNRTFADAITLDDFTDVDAITKDTTAAKTNIIGFGDVHSFGTNKPVLEAVTVSELSSFGFEKSETDSVGISEAFQKVATFSRQLDENIPLTDAPTHSLQKPFSDGTVLSEAFQKDVAFARTFNEAVSFSEQTVAAMERQFSEAATITESISIQVASLASSVLNAGALNTVPFNN